MADSPNSTQNREANSEEGGHNHSKTVDVDSKDTASKPLTDAVDQQKSCSSDKDSSTSRADQNDDDNDKNNSTDNFCEKRSEDVQPPCEDTSTNDNIWAATNSNFKGSNEAPADQRENRERTNPKDEEKMIDNVEVPSETNIGSQTDNDIDANAPKNEDELKDTASKQSTQAVGQQKSSSSDKDSSSSTAGQSDDDNDNSNLIDDDDKCHSSAYQHIADNNLESNAAENKVEEMKENKSEEQSLALPLMKANTVLRRPRESTIRKIVDQTEQNKNDKKQQKMQKEEGTVHQTSYDSFGETKSDDVQPLCDDISTDDSKEVAANSDEKGSNKAPADQEVNRRQNNLKDGENEINNVKRFSETPLCQSHDVEELKQTQNTGRFEAPNIVQAYDSDGNSSNDDTETDEIETSEEKVGTPRYNAQTGESVHRHPFIQGGNQIYQPNANGSNQHLDNDDNDQVGIGNNLPAAGGPSSPNDPDRDRLRNELIAKDQQIAELLAQIAELLAQIADLRMRERRNKDAIVNTEYEKNSLRRERDEARRTISTLTMTKDGLIDDVTGLEENVRILEEKLHTTEEDNVTKDANIDTIRSRNSELQANCKTLSENLTAAKKKCTSLEANQRRLDEKVQCLEKDLEKLAEENTAKSVEISSLKESCGTLKESENHHRGECDKLKKAYDEEKDKTRFMEDRMNSLSGRVDALEAETEQKDRMIHRKESARQAANEAMQKSQDENQVLCEQLRDLQSLQVQLEQEKAKNHAATEQLIALRQQLSGMDTMQRNIHIWWEEYRLAMNERTQEKADYETCRRRLQTLESELVYVKEERDSLRETTRVDQIEKDRLNAHKHDLTTKLQNQVGQITNMSEEVRNRREAMDTYRREKENLKDRSFELERSLLTAERQIEGLKRDISDKDRDILNLRAQLSDVSDPRDGDGDNGGPGHGSGGHWNQGGSTAGETNSGQQGFFPNTQSSTVHHRPQTPSNSVGLRGQQSQGTPTSSIFGISVPTSFTFATPTSSSTPLRQHLSGNQGGPSFFSFGSPNSTA